ncbi:MAG: DUF262 domain-containing protein [Clostridia bacterium]|nr:DUF262 domain-containing protein [Clostridia bacterium]
MAVQHISIKKLTERINAANNPWLLPAIQRLYAWGERSQSEKYMIRPFDSLMKDYPVGMLLIWNCDKPVPYRDFCTDYEDDKIPNIVDSSQWARPDKFLVYDGQQRVQTIFSLMRYSVNGRVLVYNFIKRVFEFVDKGLTKIESVLYLAELFTKDKQVKSVYRDSIKTALSNSPDTFEQDFDDLWFVFNDEKAEKIPYFEMSSSFTETQVADVFHRINTTGLSLSATDILMSKIKVEMYDYEERLEEISVEIEQVAGSYKFTRNNILQVAHLINADTTKINVDNFPPVTTFTSQLSTLKQALKLFFNAFLYEEFGINTKQVIVSEMAMYPLIVYIYERLVQGKKSIAENTDDLKAMKKYFILSQYNGWSTQTIIVNCSKLAKNAVKQGKVFPLQDIETFVLDKGNRVTTITESLLNYKNWFTLKVLMPNQVFTFAPSVFGRFAPEIDHIFPKKLSSPPIDYFPDVVWNMQPVQGLKNLYKTNQHPLDYFNENTPNRKNYHYMPIVDKSGKWDMTHTLWNKPMEFIAERKKIMKKQFENLYDLKLK